jgi:AraC-like DNA-binding protein
VTTSLDYTEKTMAEVNNDYLGGSPGFSIRESTDLDHYRAQPGRWTVDVTQLSKGSFGSRIRSIELPGLIAYHNQWDCSALIHGQSPDDWLMIGGIIDSDRAAVTWCGQRKDRRNYAATGPCQEIEFNVEPQASNVVVLMEPSLLARSVGGQAVDTLLGTKHVDFGSAGSRLIDIVMNMLATVEEQPELLDRTAIVSRAVSTLMRGVEDCFSSLNVSMPEEQTRSRGDVVHKAILHVHASGDATSALEMAQAVGVSQKTLELAFREVMNTTPGKYLVLTRLNHAHHALAYADKTSTSVTDVAMSLGFSHMGRFAGAYKQLFGELPSETLER